MIKKSNTSINGFQRYFLMGVLLILLALLITFISPFGVDLLIAGIIVAAVYPAHKWIIKKIPFSRSLSALISMILIIIIILLPFTLFGFFVAEQAADAYVAVSNRINIIVETNDVSTTSKILELIPYSHKIEGVFKYLPFSTADLLQTARDAVGVASSFLLSKTTNILKHLSVFLVHLLIFLVSLFYFLREGDRLVNYVRSLLPMSRIYRQELFTKLSKLSYGIIYGIFGAAIIQGFLVGVGFAVAGIGNAAFWGVIAALFSPVPYIGTMVIWLPAVVITAIGGKYITAVLLLAWSVLIAGSADNVIKPYIIGSSAHLHPLATLLVLLGGTFVFGLKGLIFGPFVLTLALAFLHIYKLEYKAILEKEEKDLFPELTVKKKKSR
ncbi:AI-2E family transporter [Patescibacteria group bacterium]|nr:AI-2E family transporter [Patescibacteria group bacterium]MBU1015543.1 AI-2E family transporter [Patescibacteria group bacterium]MBU1685594.1 AI-2E family transporter [Patescibacteria group bacterium]MBU1938988.1 AI-2E family transporter [Patescibacteria group bacterium]